MVGFERYLTGSCRHPEWSTRRDASLKPCTFPMYAAVLDRGGELAVFDPGYAPRFQAATDPFPERFYRWLTPTQVPAEGALAATLGRNGLLPAVTTVIISHFHADHVAGLKDFPGARVVCSRGAWNHVRSVSGLRAVRAGLWVSDRFGQARPDGPDALTAREIEVLELLAEGLANKQLAEILGISENTVKFHLSSVFSKL